MSKNLIDVPKNPIASNRKWNKTTRMNPYSKNVCHICGIRPRRPEMIQPLITSQGDFDLCPICALDVRNQMIGLPAGTPFQGEIANDMYEDMID